MRGVLLLFGLAMAGPVLADSRMDAAPYAYVQLANPAQEKAAKHLMESVRCLVCQGQSIADSDSELAGDMRSMIRERIARGEKPEAIRQWLVGRYGDWVSYSPPTKGSALVLWLLPMVLLLSGGAVAAGRIRRRRR
jgi:cytochrome c-type biogenesis protein CcmH